MSATAPGIDTITFREIARDLRVDASTVRRAADRGALQTVRIGRTRRVLRASYEAFIASGGEHELPGESDQ